MDHRMICDVLVILMAAVWTLDNSGIAGFGVSLVILRVSEANPALVKALMPRQLLKNRASNSLTSII
ncbi:hypothetical protein OIU77_030142 [Salix suchowensis]|uniref:PIN-like protein n=1 Tax=Salix suchowensis TaxID=1278906 RepID=A0ABQ9BE82_9ROSI|nr:hypothetical protein OIU77_030142 [Salix suchowensis]